MTERYRSDFHASLHEMMQAAHRIGAIDAQVMRDFDRRCLSDGGKLHGSEIRAMREREQISRAEFARTLFVSPQQVARWESGQSKPRGAALKLLTLVQQHGLKALA